MFKKVVLTYYRDVDGDGYGNAALIIKACAQPIGYVSNNTDCNDSDIHVRTGYPEKCDGLDSDCRPETMEQCPSAARQCDGTTPIMGGPGPS